MVQPTDLTDPIPDSDLIERVKQLGYAPSKTIRFYGQEYEVTSDPFMQGENVAVQVRRAGETRTLRLPSTIFQKILKRAS